MCQIADLRTITMGRWLIVEAFRIRISFCILPLRDNFVAGSLQPLVYPNTSQWSCESSISITEETSKVLRAVIRGRNIQVPGAEHTSP